MLFFGHRKISETDNLRERLYKIIEDLILYNKIETFLFGSKSEFDKLCLEIVTELKEIHPHILRIYVRAEYPYINDDYKEYLLQSYEDTYFPERALNSGKAVYIERNYEMIDKSDYCVIYYKENYMPQTGKSNKYDIALCQPRSGTRIAYEYAKRKKKNIIIV